MKKSTPGILVFFIAALLSGSLFAQDWVQKMQDPNVNFYEVQKAFNTYYENAIQQQSKSGLPSTQSAGTPAKKVPGMTQYKRWEHFMQPRVSATGARFAPDAVWSAMSDYKKKYNTLGAGNWTLIGPSSVSGIAGAGRCNFVVIHPVTPTTMWVGTPAGGLWRSTDGGITWTTDTDQLPQVIGCSDLAIDPVVPNTMYLSTGDINAGDSYSVGLLKTTDGGATWNPTGLTFNVSQARQMGKIKIDPSNNNIVIVATSNGIYRSTDAGVSFSIVQAGSFKDLELKPGDPSTVYACGTEFYKSTNTGATWVKTTSGLPTGANVIRMAICVTPADPALVYLVAMKSVTYDMEGVYKSTNSGTSFLTKLSSPNIGNQGFYDLCIAANPANASEVMLGGQNQFMKSTNGAVNWTNSIGSMHVDFHDITYFSSTTLYVTNDGGVFKSTNNGGAWTNLSTGLAIAQLHGFGHSSTNPNLILQGAKDNGTYLYNGSSWTAVMGGDGMLAFISHANDNNMWGSQYSGALNRSTNGGGLFSAMSTISETCPWVTPWLEDPVTGGTVYAGCANVWKATAGTFIKPGNVAGSSTVAITALAVSPANNQILWTAKGGTLYKSTNAAVNWTAVTGLPAGTISDIVCHPTDVNKVWVTYSGFSNINKVFQSTDQGANWTNLSTSLPNIPVNCITIDKNGNDALYIGTDCGAFFKDAAMSIWQPFTNGLPNTVVTQMEIFYPGSKIRASTFGRGIWESSLYSGGSYMPDANFAGNFLIGCPGLGVQFMDYSSGMPTSWSWSFPGGTPATSTLQNPFVAYNTSGTFSVTLTATNANGSDAQSYTNYITIGNSANAPPTVPAKNFCAPGTVTLTATPSAPGTVRWWNQPAGGYVVATGNTYAPTLSVTTTFYADEAFASGNIDFIGAPDNTMGTGAMFTANDNYGLYFDVLKPVVINSVKVYSNTAGIRTIEILDSNGNLVTDTTLSIAASGSVTPTTVTINRTLYPGTGYLIKFRGTVDCFRNTAGATFPYLDGGSNALTVTGSLNGYYYFFYDWQFTNITCNTGRTAVTATDTCFGNPPCPPPPFTLSHTDATACNGGNDGSATATATGGATPFTFSWNTNPVQTTGTATGLSAGTYSVQVTDALACSTTSVVVVSVASSPTITIDGTTNASSCVLNDGAISITATGGTGPYTYLWSPGSSTTDDITGLSAGLYAVTVTDAGGCTASATATITSPSGVSAILDSIFNSTCNASNNGGIFITTVGGLSPYTYAWSNSTTTEDITGLSIGSYSVLITDVNSCSFSLSSTISEPTALSATASVTHETCVGSNNGSVDLSVSGGTAPYSYSWSPGGQTTQDVSGLAAGSYSISVTDSNGCTVSGTYSVSPAIPLVLVLDSTKNNSCSTGNNGGIYISLSGGAPAYSYSWNSSQTTQDISGLNAGNYSVTVSDSKGCTAATSATVTAPSTFTVSIGAVVPAGCSFSNGSISVNTNGGTPAYSYAWLPSGGSSSAATGLGIGNYSVTVTDANGCSTAFVSALGDSCDFVWPGDANDDGMANNLDILTIGIGYGSTGALRSGASLNWIGQPCAGWSNTLASGSNYKHVDCNGDGTIDDSDTLAVVQNYGLVHNNKIINPVVNANTDIYTQITTDSVGSGGSLVTVQIGLGTVAAPATNVYGVAYTISFSDPSLVDLPSIAFTGQNSWLGTLGTDMMAVGFPNGDAAVTRINQSNVSGNGFIHTLTFLTSSTLNGSGNSAELEINITNATVISVNETVIPVNQLSDSLVVQDTVMLLTSVNSHGDPAQIVLYPNPSKGEFTIYCQQSIIGSEMRIMNILGEIIFRKTVNSKSEKVDLKDTPNGIYFLQVRTEDGILTKKFTKE